MVFCSIVRLSSYTSQFKWNRSEKLQRNKNETILNVNISDFRVNVTQTKQKNTFIIELLP